MMLPLSLRIDQYDDHACLAIDGDIDQHTAGQVRKAAFDLLDERPQPLVLDFSGVAFCDSAGISTLVAIYHRADRAGGSLTLRQVSDAVRQALDITGITRLIMVEDGTPSGGRE
jgi:anti-sigma B factor antagonist